jgi:uncharacterized spore protein YtfJ
MSDGEKVLAAAETTREQMVELMERLFAVTRPGAVFSEPIEAEGTTVITASEVSVGMGLGFGMGSGSGPAGGEEDEGEEAPEGTGSGGGGGGGASGRPVAVISVNKYGVEVEPVVDVTKVSLGFFAAFTSLVIMLGSMRRASKKG